MGALTLAQTRSPEREALAEAIRRRSAATARIERLTEAAEGHSVWQAREAVEEAEAALKEARKREPQALVAKVLGDPCGPSVQAALDALTGAKAALDLAEKTRDALDGQLQAAEAELGSANSALKKRIAEVVHSEGAASAVLAEYVEARREVARLHEILSLLSSRNCLPAYWDTTVYYPPTNAEAPWRAALAALENDADAELP
jgi:hypothetical protein